MKTASVDIVTAMVDKGLFGATFAGSSWDAWRVVLKAAFGLGLSSPWEHQLYRRCTGRSVVPTKQVRELWMPTGRRGGKSRIMAVAVVFLACFRSYAKILAPGENGKVVVVAADRQQAQVVFQYVWALLDGSPMLRRMVSSKTRESIRLRNRVDIEIHTASFRSSRGYTIVAFVGDECAFWRDETSANPDSEILAAVRPSMATVPGSMLLMISSPYARRGALHETHARYFGKNDSGVLVWQSESRTMNPTLPQEIVDRAYREDPLAAAAEFGAEFRRDVESFVSLEVVSSCTIAGRHEIPPMPSTKYFGFVDPSGGSQDSMTLAIAHVEKGVAMLDAIREAVPPFSPDQVVSEFCDLLRTYRIVTVQGDRYGGLWPREVFAKHGVRYDANAAVKSELYKSLLPALNSGKVELLDHARLRSQLLGLERRTSRGGRDTIDHGPRGHDDVINAAAGALVLAMGKRVPLNRAPTGVGTRPSYWRPGAPSRIPPQLDWRASDYDG